MQPQAHTGSREPQHAKQQGTGAATGQRGQAERRQASQGRVQSVGAGGPAQPGDRAARARDTRLLTSPAAPLTTGPVFPQEAGGVLERVESGRQGAVGTEPGLQEKVPERSPAEGCWFGELVAEVVSKCQMKIDPPRPPPACARGAEKGTREQWRRPHTGPPETGTCLSQPSTGSVWGENLSNFPGGH